MTRFDLLLRRLIMTEFKADVLMDALHDAKDRCNFYEVEKIINEAKHESIDTDIMFNFDDESTLLVHYDEIGRPVGCSVIRPSTDQDGFKDDEELDLRRVN